MKSAIIPDKQKSPNEELFDAFIDKHSEEKTLELLSEAIRKGADITAKHHNGRTVLHYAAMRNYIEIIKFLYQKAPLLLDKQDNHLLTPLMLVSNPSFQPEAAKMLITLKADQSIAAKNSSALSSAVLSTHRYDGAHSKDILLDLVRAFDLKHTDTEIFTRAFSSAIYYKNTQLVDLLFTNRPDDVKLTNKLIHLALDAQFYSDSIANYLIPALGPATLLKAVKHEALIQLIKDSTLSDIVLDDEATSLVGDVEDASE